jgi:hypothetical protein
MKIELGYSIEPKGYAGPADPLQSKYFCKHLAAGLKHSLLTELYGRSAVCRTILTDQQLDQVLSGRFAEVAQICSECRNGRK